MDRIISEQKRLSKRGKERLKAAGKIAEGVGLVNGRIELIQQLIPLGLEAVNEVLQLEVKRLVGGDSHERVGTPIRRWGSNPGSVILGGQKVGMRVPRVRDEIRGEEIPLDSYRQFRREDRFDERVFLQLINGLSAGRYAQAAELVTESFGVSKSSVSRRFKKATEKRLKELYERDLSQYDIVAMFIDGKSLSGTDMIIALGITMKGEKVILGFIETTTENGNVCKDFMNKLIERGLNIENEILFVIDGSKGIYKGIKAALGNKAIIQRCQWHKRENVISYLPKRLHDQFRRKLQAAYEQPTYAKAKAKLMAIRKELKFINESAVASLDEGLEETLTIHRLGLFIELGRSFKTTNCVENINRQVENVSGRVCRWQNSNQRQRWIASALLQIEPRLNKINGYKHLGLLREKMKQQHLQLKQVA